MICKGRFGLYEPVSGVLTLNVGRLTTVQLEALEKLRERVIEIELKLQSKPKSLDSLRYMWKLCDLIAHHKDINSSKDEVYENMIQKYGYLEADVTITVKSEVDMSKMPGHWKFIKSNGTFSAYMMIRGCSTYTSVEMSHFVSMVVDEAKELGIQTATPAELAEMQRLYEARYGSNF